MTVRPAYDSYMGVIRGTLVRVLVLAGLVGLAAAGCGTGDDDQSDTSVTGQTTQFDPATATLREKIARYETLYERRGIASRYPVSSDELPSVAANLCDNSVNDMEFFLDAGSVIDIAEEYAAEGVTVIDAFCPEARLQYEAAADTIGIPVPPPPKD